MQKNIQWKAELLGKRAFVYALFKGSYCILVYSVCRGQKEPAPLQWLPHKWALHRCSDVPITSGCSLPPLVAHATSNKSIYPLDVLPEPYSNRHHMSSVEQEHIGWILLIYQEMLSQYSPTSAYTDKNNGIIGSKNKPVIL